MTAKSLFNQSLTYMGFIRAWLSLGKANCVAFRVGRKTPTPAHISQYNHSKAYSDDRNQRYRNNSKKSEGESAPYYTKANAPVSSERM
jgi:hypothetical protein